jgi:hypothetical protein
MKFKKIHEITVLKRTYWKNYSQGLEPASCKYGREGNAYDSLLEMPQGIVHRQSPENTAQKPEDCAR